MEWSNCGWEEQKCRFEKVDDEIKIDYTFKYIYWFGENWSNIMFAKIFLNERLLNYQIFWDMNMRSYMIITNYNKDENN